MAALLILVAVYSMILAAGQVLVKFGINEIGKLEAKGLKDLLPIISSFIQNLKFFLGVVVIMLSFFLWFYILSQFSVSIAFPLSSMALVFAVFFSEIFLKERVTIYNILGTLLICFGIFILLYGN